MPKPIQSKTGNAPTVKVGHTESNRYGSNSKSQVRGGSPSRDLGIK